MVNQTTSLGFPSLILLVFHQRQKNEQLEELIWLLVRSRKQWPIFRGPTRSKQKPCRQQTRPIHQTDKWLQIKESCPEGKFSAYLSSTSYPSFYQALQFLIVFLWQGPRWLWQPSLSSIPTKLAKAAHGEEGRVSEMEGKLLRLGGEILASIYLSPSWASEPLASSSSTLPGLLAQWRLYSSSKVRTLAEGGSSWAPRFMRFGGNNQQGKLSCMGLYYVIKLKVNEWNLLVATIHTDGMKQYMGKNSEYLLFLCDNTRCWKSGTSAVILATDYLFNMGNVKRKNMTQMRLQDHVDIIKYQLGRRNS